MRTITYTATMILMVIILISNLEKEHANTTNNIFRTTPTIEPKKIISHENISQLGEVMELEFESAIPEIQWSPSDEYLAIGVGEGNLQLFYLPDRELIDLGNTHSRFINLLRFNDSSTLLLSADIVGTVNIWDLETLTIVQTFTTENNVTGFEAVSDAIFTEDSQILLTRPNGDVERRQLDGDLTHSFSTQQSDLGYYTTSIVFGSDGQRVASMTPSGNIEIWDIASETVVLELEGHSSDIWTMDFTSDNEMLASGSDDYTIWLWSMKTGIGIHLLEGHTFFVRIVRFSPDNQLLASSGHDDTVRFWDIETGKELRELQWQGTITGLEFSNDGQMLAIAIDNKVSF